MRAAVVMLWVVFYGCANVDTILLTSDTFPPRSPATVIVLEHTPSESHIDLAELRIGDSWLSFGSLQKKILKRAADLGADAVVFTSPQTQTIRQVAYEPLYDPWGYNSPYYGSPWRYGGYGGWGPRGGFSSSSVPYDETIKMLMGTAIRYTRQAGLSQHVR
jgi:Starvation-inducible outer membrane lipoprotein